MILDFVEPLANLVIWFRDLIAFVDKFTFKIWRRVMVVICNFTPTVRHGWRIGVPHAGPYRERLNTDSEHYGGSNVGSAFGACETEDIPWNERPQSIVLTLPPLATLFIEWTP